jgi:hypothetical protein
MSYDRRTPRPGLAAAGTRQRGNQKERFPLPQNREEPAQAGETPVPAAQGRPDKNNLMSHIHFVRFAEKKKAQPNAL